jgi:hypothetical protein
MTKQHKQIAIIIGAGIVLYLLYRHYLSNQASNTTVAPPADSGQYAALAGQEQSDVANLQRQLFGLTQLERQLQHEVTKIAAGDRAFNRTKIRVKKGSKFYDYYRRVTGKNPPAWVWSDNFIWQAFENGIKAAVLAGRRATSSGSSGAGSSGNATFHHKYTKHRHVAHPNPTHDQNGGGHHNHAPVTGGSSPQPHRDKHNTHRSPGTRPSGARR